MSKKLYMTALASEDVLALQLRCQSSVFKKVKSCAATSWITNTLEWCLSCLNPIPGKLV